MKNGELSNPPACNTSSRTSYFSITVMVFTWPFLPPLSPLTRQTGEVLCGVQPELITWAGAKTNYLKDHSAKTK
jgi:hypothetical protein